MEYSETFLILTTFASVIASKVMANVARDNFIDGGNYLFAAAEYKTD